MLRCHYSSCFQLHQILLGVFSSGFFKDSIKRLFRQVSFCLWPSESRKSSSKFTEKVELNFVLHSLISSPKNNDNRADILLFECNCSGGWNILFNIPPTLPRTRYFLTVLRMERLEIFGIIAIDESDIHLSYLIISRREYKGKKNLFLYLVRNKKWSICD